MTLFSLIYQLQDYQQALNGRLGTSSSRSSLIGDDEADWSRKRRMLDIEESENTRDSAELREARALDKAMEERVVSRKASSSSSLSSSSRIGNRSATKSQYYGRKRTGSIASNISFLSEHLIEEDEEEELLGIGGGFDAPSISTRSPSGDTTEEEVNSSPELKKDSLPPPSTIVVPLSARPFPPPRHRSLNDLDSLRFHAPPSAPAHKTSFGFQGLGAN